MAIHVEAGMADGRRLRSQSSRRAIVAAMLALVREGNVAPSAEDVAGRGKVGLRTVFRHFENMESLYREMNEVMEAQVLPLAEKPFAAHSWRANLDELIARRAEIFERIMPLKIASDVHRHRSAFLDKQMRHLVRLQRSALAALLPRDLTADTHEALDLALSFDTWRRLRLDQKLTPKRAREVMAHMAARLVD